MIEIRCLRDIKEAEEVWRALSPQELIFDLWKFRFCFYQFSPKPLYFYTAYDNGEPVALLPLQYGASEDWTGLEFFSEEFSLCLRPFVKPGYEYLIPKLFQSLPVSAKFLDLLGVDEFTKSLPIDDYLYYLEIGKFKNFDDYLLSAFPNGRKRYNFKRLFTLLEKEHQVKVVYNDFNDLELLMDLNFKHFGEESYFHSDYERQSFKSLLTLPLDWRMITIVVDGVKLACSLAVIYKKTYYYLIVGSDISEVRDVFKYLTKVNLELALKEGLEIFDLALGNCGWKEFWHPSKTPQYEFDNGLKIYGEPEA